jgi:hypothetical protein
MIWLEQRKGFLAAFVATIALLVGLISGVLTLLGTHFTIRATVACLVVSTAAAVLLHRNRLHPQQLSSDVVPESPKYGFKKLCCPCTTPLAKQVASLAKICFGGNTIALDHYEQLRVKNENILACLTSVSGRFLGYFDILPIDDSFAKLFMSGKLGEKDLTHEHVLGLHEMESAHFVYLSGIASENPTSMTGMQNASILVWASFKYLDHFYGKSVSIAFASAVTKEGERLLQRLGFSLHSAAEARSDKAPTRDPEERTVYEPEEIPMH